MREFKGRIVTPGTLIESTMLDETKNNYLCSVYEHNKSYGVCFADVSTAILLRITGFCPIRITQAG